MLRPDLSDLVSRLSDLGIDIALTTNGSLLRRNAEALAEAGLKRVTISLDAIDEEVHQQMSDSSVTVSQILDGIEAAREVGLSQSK